MREWLSKSKVRRILHIKLGTRERGSARTLGKIVKKEKLEQILKNRYRLPIVFDAHKSVKGRLKKGSYRATKRERIWEKKMKVEREM